MNSYHYLLCIKLEGKWESFMETRNLKGFMELCDLFKSWAENRPKCPVQVGVDIIIDFPAFVRAGSPRSRDKDLFYLIAAPKGINVVCYPPNEKHWKTMCASVDNGELHLFPWTELQRAIELDAILNMNSGWFGGEAIATASFIRGN